MKFLRYFSATCCSVALLVLLLVGSVAYQLNQTALNGAFVQGEVERLDVVSLMRDEVVRRLPPDAVDFGPAIAETIDQHRAELKAQISAAIAVAHDYLTARRDDLRIPLQLDGLRRDLVQNLRRSLREKPPAQIRDLPPPEQARAAAELEQEIEKQVMTAKVPQVITLDACDANVKEAMANCRLALGMFRTGTAIFIGLTAALAVAVFLLGSMRWLGIVGLLAGGLTFSFFMAWEKFIRLAPAAEFKDLPEKLFNQCRDLALRGLRPLEIYAWVCIAAGAGLLVLSFVRLRPASPAAPPPSSAPPPKKMLSTPPPARG